MLLIKAETSYTFVSQMCMRLSSTLSAKDEVNFDLVVFLILPTPFKVCRGILRKLSFKAVFHAYVSAAMYKFTDTRKYEALVINSVFKNVYKSFCTVH